MCACVRVCVLGRRSSYIAAHLPSTHRQLAPPLPLAAGAKLERRVAAQHAAVLPEASILVDVGGGDLVHREQLAVHPVLRPCLLRLHPHRLPTFPKRGRLPDGGTVAVTEGDRDDGTARSA